MDSVIPVYSGFIVAFEPARSKKIWALLESGNGFRDSFSVDDWELSRKEIFFLTLKKRRKAIDAVALVQRAHGDGGTGKPKYQFDNAIVIDPPIFDSDLSDVIHNLAENISSPTSGYRIDEFLWSRLVEKIKKLRPEIASKLDELLSFIDKEASLLGGTHRLDRLAEQRDGLGTAMDIGGIQRTKYLKDLDANKADTANSVLDLFDNLPIHERHIIEHDKQMLEKIFSDGYHGVQFTQGINQVRVYVADKTKLETALGTDLIIYQSLWNSMILVQYKLMKNGSKEEKGWKYRPNVQFDQQTNQIKKFMNSYPESNPRNPWELRLCDDPFYFKFCEKRRPTSRDDSLVRGLSMSCKVLNKFLEMPESLGPNEGRVIGYDNCPRYLNNSEFTSMAKMGWIGSGGKGTDFLEKRIREVINPKREPLVAIIDTPRLGTAELRKASRTASSGLTAGVSRGKSNRKK